jgi:hypothetical protein
MAAELKPTPTKPAAKPSAPKQPAPKQPAPPPTLASAAASSDPAVHQLLAEMDIARANSNDDEVQRAQGALRDLGFE